MYQQALLYHVKLAKEENGRKPQKGPSVMKTRMCNGDCEMVTQYLILRLKTFLLKQKSLRLCPCDVVATVSGPTTAVFTILFWFCSNTDQKNVDGNN